MGSKERPEGQLNYRPGVLHAVRREVLKTFDPEKGMRVPLKTITLAGVLAGLGPGSYLAGLMGAVGGGIIGGVLGEIMGRRVERSEAQRITTQGTESNNTVDND